MSNLCYTRSLYSLPRKYLKVILSVCDDTDLANVVIIGHLRFTVWTKNDPILVERI